MLCAEYGGLTRILLVKKLLESCEITDFDYKHLNIFKMGKDSIQYTNIMKREGRGLRANDAKNHAKRLVHCLY